MGVDDEMILAPIKTQSCRFLSGRPLSCEVVAGQMHEAALAAQGWPGSYGLQFLQGT